MNRTIDTIPQSQQTWRNLGDIADPARDAEALAIIDLGAGSHPRSYTYAELDGLTNGVAQYLVNRGLRRGDPVAILSMNRAEFLIAYFGILRAGMVVVPVNIKLAGEAIDYVLSDAGVVLAFTDDPHCTLVPPAIPSVDFDDTGPEGWMASIQPAEFDPVVPTPEETGQMLYTSGSTGRPKGVRLSHTGQLWALDMLSNAGRNQPERVLLAQPLFHMNGLFVAKVTFATHGLVVLQAGFDARAYIDALARYRITWVSAVPTMLARVIKEADLLAASDLSSIHRMTLASAPMTRGLLQRIQETFPNVAITFGYGTTEAGPAVFGPHPDGLPTPHLSIGYPLPTAEVRLVDGPGPDHGVLEMRNPAVMQGYHNLPDRTVKVLHDGWYNSGDIVRRDENGFFFFVGRADDMFNCSGENIYPGDIEKMLESHPLIQQAAVVPLPDEERSQVPVAFLVLHPGASLSVAEIKQYALEHGPAYQHPRRIKFVTELPWAGTNKVDRNRLTAQAKELETSAGWS
ncbi:acyl--CoA ligase [Acetobacter sp. TBRC 12305]|uniref:Acyl--CoA ligase n=1 Tax=Acetobacter garciniae TaxID=2817435 RepID=A0A939HPX3_9PROT|nr:class I adenylate-forming enzyme family protein [Acetobacter garciniae]MBO1325687.1 acyl--CoA ligase [Acetobacter garciniae]MBX0345587.1 acyl--CoA ligase [Acetobacter garciniae]